MERKKENNLVHLLVHTGFRDIVLGGWTIAAGVLVLGHLPVETWPRIAAAWLVGVGFGTGMVSVGRGLLRAGLQLLAKRIKRAAPADLPDNVTLLAPRRPDGKEF